MSNYALKSDGTPLEQIEQKLRDYLPGLDARLFPWSPAQAVLREHLFLALDTDYPVPGAAALLRSFGAADLRPISDEATLYRLEGRDVDDLPRRRAERVAPVAGFDWHLSLLKVPAAWARVGGGPDTIDWRGVKVGLVDTGYTQHPALGFAAQTWLDLANARTTLPAVPAGEGGLLPPEAGQGVDNLDGLSGGHGTRMAATICGHAASAAGGAYYGIAPKVPLVPVRITNSVWISHAQREFAEAVEHLVDTAGAKVISVSLGVFPGPPIKAMRKAVNAAYDAGVIVVCAAGNFVNSVVAPANLPRTLAVAGVDQRMAPWSGSSFGPAVDFSGPAVNLRRASTEGPGQFVYAAGGDGTSYATASTSGAAALWLAHHAARLDALYPEPWQRVEAFRKVARDTAQRPPDWNPGSFGTGVLDVDALLGAALPPAGSLEKSPKA